MDESVTPKTNRLLAALPNAAYRRLLPNLEATKLRDGDALLAANGSMKYAYFPTSSIVALLYDDSKKALVNAWPVGREGMLGISLFLGVPKFVKRADVHIGGHAFRLPAAALVAEFQQAGALQKLLLRYVFALIAQASLLGMCGKYHPIEQRLCRFLLEAFDGVDGNEIDVTQQRIAGSLGVRRVSVTQAAIQLQADELIEYERGHVKLLNRRMLEARSCECTRVIRRVFAAVSG